MISFSIGDIDNADVSSPLVLTVRGEIGRHMSFSVLLQSNTFLLSLSLLLRIFHALHDSPNFTQGNYELDVNVVITGISRLDLFSFEQKYANSVVNRASSDQNFFCLES